MQFNSYIFIFLFFPLTLVGYYGLNHAGLYKASRLFLISISMCLCAYESLYSLIILIISVFLNYRVILFILKSSDSHRRKTGLYIGFLLNIGFLFLFKYYNFFIDNITAVIVALPSSAKEAQGSLPALKLALPLGISFYTFQQLSCIIDTFRGECIGYSFEDYLLYITFFPKLTQGPLVPYGELIPQFHDTENYRINFENLSRGLYAFALGLAKKVLIADTFSGIVSIGYENISVLNSTSALLVMICYSLQIYFDFSGYCDMAYGIGYMLNIKLPINFNSPYKSRSVSDFWDRWHMSLTGFFTRYLYIPLGGSRQGRIRTCLNVMVVFLVSGLWHGANWTFILWGAIHGFALVAEKMTNISSLRLPRFLKMLITFFLVTFAWSLFRATSLREAEMLWSQLFHGGIGTIYQPLTEAFQDLTEIRMLFMANSMLSPGSPLTDYSWIFLPVFTGGCLLACFTMKNTREKTEQLKLSGKTLLTVVILMFWSIMSLSEMSEFIYSSF